MAMANYMPQSPIRKTSTISAIASPIYKDPSTVCKLDSPEFGCNIPLSFSATTPVGRHKSVDEELPNIRFYQADVVSTNSRTPSRPSLSDLHENEEIMLDEIHDAMIDIGSVEGCDIKMSTEPLDAFQPPDAKVKFGWIRGVWIRCILNILGAMLYLRLGWVAAHAGISFGSLIVLISTCITTLTAISMCALCTNGEIRGGGAYFMLSRALGPEFGGSMGFIFAVADAASAGMNVVGFAETVTFLLKGNGITIVNSEQNSLRIIGIATHLTLFAIVMISVTWEAKTELLLLLIITTSYVSFVVGTLMPPIPEKIAKGVTGYQLSTFRANFFPDWYGETFISVFGVYFPSVTGIMAGAGISGDLAEPNRSIPKGTLLSILTTTLIYLSGIWFTGATCVRYASGSIEDVLNGTFSVSDCVVNGTCKDGLMFEYQVMELEGAYPPLVTAGIFATCLSSSLTCLVSSPRTFQALSRDHLYPFTSFLGKGSGSQDEPRIATVVATIIGLLVISIGDLNTVAPFVSNLYLASFALINYACFDGSIAKSPGWRPAFRYYNMWLSLLGAVMCIIAMFVLHYPTALGTLAIISALYVYLLRRKPAVNWGSSGQANTYKNALQGMLQLLSTEEHVKNYRPQFLVFSGNPVARPCMLDFVSSITKDSSLAIYGHIIKADRQSIYCGWMNDWTSMMYDWLKKRKNKGFYSPVAVHDFNSGCEALLQLAGLGKLRPNIAMIGFKSDWTICPKDEIKDYYQLIHECFDHDMALCILRINGGLDYSEHMKRLGIIDSRLISPIRKKSSAYSRESSIIDEPIRKLSASKNGYRSNLKRLILSPASLMKDRIPKRSIIHRTSLAQKGLMLAMNQFRRRVRNAIIDVWWLTDDGGLTLLIPHLLTLPKSYLDGAKLRVFTMTKNEETVEEEAKNLHSLLSKFRISFADIHVLPNDLTPLDQNLIDHFSALVLPFKKEISELEDPTDADLYVDSWQLETLQRKTRRHLHRHELLEKHSRDASLIVITLPIPRKGRVSAYLYLAWLEMLTRNLPPVLFVRGNQKSVLTFYS